MKSRTGYVTKRGKSWMARLTFTDPETGGRKDVRRFAPTKSEANDILQDLRQTCKDHGARPIEGERLTVAKLMEHYTKARLKPAEYHGDRKVAGMRSHRSAENWGFAKWGNKGWWQDVYATFEFPTQELLISIDRWGPLMEAEADFRDRAQKRFEKTINDYVARVKGAINSTGRYESVTSKDSLEHFDWFIRSHIQGWSLQKIRTHYKANTDAAVSKGLNEVKRLLGIDRGQRGRPKINFAVSRRS